MVTATFRDGNIVRSARFSLSEPDAARAQIGDRGHGDPRPGVGVIAGTVLRLDALGPEPPTCGCGRTRRRRCRAGRRAAAPRRRSADRRTARSRRWTSAWGSMARSSRQRGADIGQRAWPARASAGHSDPPARGRSASGISASVIASTLASPLLAGWRRDRSPRRPTPGRGRRRPACRARSAAATPTASRLKSPLSATRTRSTKRMHRRRRRARVGLSRIAPQHRGRLRIQVVDERQLALGLRVELVDEDLAPARLQAAARRRGRGRTARGWSRTCSPRRTRGRARRGRRRARRSGRATNTSRDGSRGSIARAIASWTLGHNRSASWLPATMITR